VQPVECTFVGAYVRVGRTDAVTDGVAVDAADGDPDDIAYVCVELPNPETHGVAHVLSVSDAHVVSDVLTAQSYARADPDPICVSDEHAYVCAYVRVVRADAETHERADDGAYGQSVSVADVSAEFTDAAADYVTNERAV